MTSYRTKSLNPYFNGFTILTFIMLTEKKLEYSCLNPYFNGFTILTLPQNLWYKLSFHVSILILMDSLFLQIK